jgi:hypothetical protein
MNPPEYLAVAHSNISEQGGDFYCEKTAGLILKTLVKSHQLPGPGPCFQSGFYL